MQLTRALAPVTDTRSRARGTAYFTSGAVVHFDPAGSFVYAVVRGSERLTPARWMAYASQAGDKPVTVAIFDAPTNPRHPNKIFTMRPFAYLSATLDVARQPLTVKNDAPLTLRWGAAAWDGRVDAEAVEKVYQAWVKNAAP